MRTRNLLSATLFFSLLPISSAWAGVTGNGTTVYNSGILILAFLGVCALIVVMQLIPALITMFGMLKGLLGESSKAKEKGSVPR